jgi:hypothetical protein
MRIVLQNRKSLLYVKTVHEWTPDADHATDFQQLMRAIDFVWTADLKNLDVLMLFGQPGYDIRIPASV